jgi:hypothetical protein
VTDGVRRPGVGGGRVLRGIVPTCGLGLVGLWRGL